MKDIIFNQINFAFKKAIFVFLKVIKMNCENHDEKYLLSDQQRRGYKTNSFIGRGQIFHIIDKLFTKFYYIKKR